MTISQTRAYYGLRSTVTPTSPSSSGSLNVGIASSNINLPAVTTTYSIQSLIVGSGSDLIVNLATGAKTGTTAWTAGVAQVETSTIVAGSGATTGTLALVLTDAGMTGSPVTVNVPLVTATHTTPALIATAARAALTANTVVADRWTVGGTSAAITLTRKPTATYTVGSVSVPTYPANDGTAALVVPTALGITGSTSTSTTAGVLSAGCYVVGDAEDFEGNSFSTIAYIYGLLVKCETISTDAITVGGTYYKATLSEGGSMQVISPESSPVDTLTIDSVSTSLVTVVVAGSPV